VPYRFVEHTAELGLELEAPSLEGLLTEAACAFAELVAGSDAGPPARHLVELDVLEERTIVADWLNELVYLADTRAFVPRRLGSFARTRSAVRAEVLGYEDAPRPLVKAVTYNDLELVHGPGGWRARVVLDV
jgi:SHS2 domain-containing protein